LKSNFREVPRKIWNRISGIEPRNLWFELTKTQNELAKTQNELANTQNELANTQNELANTQNWSSRRDRRLHPFVNEALALVADSLADISNIEISPNDYNSPFTHFGSDKDTRHSYGQLYLELLKNIEAPKILEIGVGSLNDFPYAGFPSSGLTPGGSLKAFRNVFPKATIVGIDIDPNSIEIIKADSFYGFVVDQTSDSSLIQNKENLLNHGPFDLIIDDGFHDPHANIRTLKAYFSLLSENGTYIIEDVHETLIDFWKVLATHLPGNVEVIDLRDSRPGVDDNILISIKK